MRYATAVAFRQALEQRLKDEEARTGIRLSRLRKRVAFELLLRRLVEAAPDRWVLKGAFALDLRLDVATRPTKDIDLGRDDDEQAAIEDMAAAQQLQLNDFFTFSAIRTDDFAEIDEFTAIRFHVRAELAGRIFEQFIVDIGFSDSFDWTPDTLQTSGLLAFAGIDPVDLPAVPVAQHLAEKVHAYTRLYGEHSRPSSRPKDLVDILLIASAEPIDAGALREALERTFTARGRQRLPGALPAPPGAWERPYRRLAAQVRVESDLTVAAGRVQAFLDPVLGGQTVGRWDPDRWFWTEQ